jgi:hypothetical protein
LPDRGGSVVVVIVGGWNQVEVDNHVALDSAIAGIGNVDRALAIGLQAARTFELTRLMN